jgi:AraC-like DNA-binding protein
MHAKDRWAAALLAREAANASRAELPPAAAVVCEHVPSRPGPRRVAGQRTRSDHHGSTVEVQATAPTERHERSTNLALTVKFAADQAAADRTLEPVAEGFSTLDVARGERVEFWREMVRCYFVPLRIEPLADRELDGAVRLRSIGDLDVARVRAQPMLATRTPKHIARSIGDEYFIGLHLHGLAHAEQDGRIAILRPGDFAVFDSARPYQIAFRAADTFDHLILRIPREQLDARVARLERATAIAIKAGSTAGRLATPALRALESVDQCERFVEPVLDLVASAIAHTCELASPPAAGRQQTLATVKRYALAHLAERDLSPRRVARACFISPRQLHRLFERESTTFRAFVKQARLERIRRHLASPALAEVTIAEIGRRHGYASAPVLSRAFSQRYGSGPRAFRRAAHDRARP